MCKKTVLHLFVAHSILRDSGTTLAIYQDENAGEQYLMLSQLGRVLQEFRRTLPGMYHLQETCVCVGT